MSKKSISVIMSVYRENHEHLRQSVESVLNQTFADFEFIIVVDDPKNVELIEIIEEYSRKDSRIRFYINDENMGAARSRNRALFLCEGEYVALMDADDVCLPERIWEQKEYLDKNKNVDVVFSGRADIDENNNILIPFKSKVLSDKCIKEMLEHCDIITNPVVMVKSGILKKLGGMRSVVCAEDYDLWLRCMSLGCEFHYIDKLHLNYRIRSDSLSHKNYAKTWIGTKYALKLYKERKKTGNDSYSTSHFENYTKHSLLGNEKSTKRFNRAFDIYSDALKKRNNGNVFGMICTLLRSFFVHTEIINVFMNSVALKKCEKKYW